MMQHEAVANSTDDTLFALRNTGARMLASDCLEAGNAFVEESAYWDKAQLAMWLLGPYSACAQNVEELPPSSRPQLRHLDANTISNVIDNARAELSHKLARLYDSTSSSDVVFSMIENGMVAIVVDANGVSGWAPTTTAHRLADRVLSLFVAAFLSQVLGRSSLSEMAMAA